jgi:hypothetical protein
MRQPSKTRAAGVEAIAIASEVTLEGLKLPRTIPLQVPA